MDFLEWLEAYEGPTDAYNRIWAPQFDKLEPERKKYFNSWFPQGQDRIYLPIKLRASDFDDMLAYDNKKIFDQINKIFASSQIFTISDWKKGLATDNRKNQWKIAKALEYLAQQAPPDKEENANTIYRNDISYLRNTYLNLRLRIGPINDMMVVISQNVHDMARMSTARGWNNCNTLSLGDRGEKQAQGDEEAEIDYNKKEIEKDPKNWALKYAISPKHGINEPSQIDGYLGDYLGDGKQYVQFRNKTIVPLDDIELRNSIRGKGYVFDKIADEILEGGLIVYLVDPSDTNLVNPFSRITLKRYENKATGHNIVICSDNTTQGVTSNKLIEFVKKWLKTKQRKIPFGSYDRSGGSWISGDKYEYEAGLDKITKSNEKYILKVLQNSNKTKISSLLYRVLGKLAEQGLSSVSSSFWKELKKITLTNKYELSDAIEQRLADILKGSPTAISKEELYQLKGSSARDILNRVSGAKKEFGYSYDPIKPEDDVLKKFQTEAKSDVEKLMELPPNRINIPNFLNILDHIDHWSPEPEFYKNILNKIPSILKSPAHSNEDKASLAKEVLSNIRHGWINYKTPEEAVKEYLQIFNQIIPSLLPHYERWEKYDLEKLSKEIEEREIVPNPKLLSWLKKI